MGDLALSAFAPMYTSRFPDIGRLFEPALVPTAACQESAATQQKIQQISQGSSAHAARLHLLGDPWLCHTAQVRSCSGAP